MNVTSYKKGNERIGIYIGTADTRREDRLTDLTNNPTKNLAEKKVQGGPDNGNNRDR